MEIFVLMCRPSKHQHQLATVHSWQGTSRYLRPAWFACHVKIADVFEGSIHLGSIHLLQEPRISTVVDPSYSGSKQRESSDFCLECLTVVGRVPEEFLAQSELWSGSWSLISPIVPVLNDTPLLTE